MNLPDELVINIFSYFEPHQLLVCGLVSKGWNNYANDLVLWRNLLRKLLQDKIYTPASILQVEENGNPKRAYWLSLKDSKRTWITKEELCSLNWSFRFKQQAGEHYTQNDPW